MGSKKEQGASSTSDFRIPPSGIGTSSEDPKSQKNTKTTITLSLDSDVVELLRTDAEAASQSLNSKINAVLRKHANFYKMIEDNKAIILPTQLHQFFIDQIDESEYTKKAEEITKDFLTSLVAQRNMAFTFDSLISFLFEGIAKNAGNISHVSRYVDQKDGKTCLFFRHDYDLKWSRILGAIYRLTIEHFLHYTTSVQHFANGFEIKIIESNPI